MEGWNIQLTIPGTRHHLYTCWHKLYRLQGQPADRTCPYLPRRLMAGNARNVDTSRQSLSRTGQRRWVAVENTIEDVR